MSVSSEIQDDLLDWNVDLNRAISARQREILRMLHALYRDLARQIREIDPTAPTYDAVKLRRLERLAADALSLISDVYQEIVFDEHQFHTEVASLSQQAIKAAAYSAIGADIISIRIAPDFLDALVRLTTAEGLTMGQWWESDGVSLGKDFYATLRQGLLQGETVGELTTRLEPLASKYDARAEALARTFGVGVNNDASLSTYTRNSDVIASIQWNATLDTRTSVICRRLDGKRWRLPESDKHLHYGAYEPIGHANAFPGSTAHFNERSTQFPVVAPYRDIPPEKQRRIPEQTRSSLDGRIPAKTTYYEWLQGQSPRRIKAVLGETRYRLMKENKLDVTDLLDMKGNPLPVSRLIAKYGRPQAA